MTVDVFSVSSACVERSISIREALILVLLKDMDLASTQDGLQGKAEEEFDG